LPARRDRSSRKFVLTVRLVPCPQLAINLDGSLARKVLGFRPAHKGITQDEVGAIVRGFREYWPAVYMRASSTDSSSGRLRTCRGPGSLAEDRLVPAILLCHLPSHAGHPSNAGAGASRTRHRSPLDDGPGRPRSSCRPTFLRTTPLSLSVAARTYPHMPRPYATSHIPSARPWHTLLRRSELWPS
jgi:hypothetical protein